VKQGDVVMQPEACDWVVLCSVTLRNVGKFTPLRRRSEKKFATR
jgi:hypothetical protein